MREAQLREGHAWECIERSLTHRQARHLDQLEPRDAVRLNAIAEEEATYYIAFAVPEGGGRGPTAAVPVPVGAGSIPLRVLWDVIEAGGLMRVKRCRRPGCGKWFADATYPNNKLGCTDACTWAVNNAKKLKRRKRR
jgi:predicted RNA-binding Zn ribbon-like protein